jgi:ABC-type dipeptide/oligopeptide/nickel transport system permease subunit
MASISYPDRREHDITIGPAEVIRPRRSRGHLLTVFAIGLVLLTVTLGPLLWPASPTEQNAVNRLQPASLQHPLGTDQFGRDTLARVLTGGRWTIFGASVVTAAVTAIGLLIAAVATSGSVFGDIIVGRAIDALLAIPHLVIALAIAAVLGPSYINLILALIIAGWPWYARAYRSMLAKEQTAGYVEGAIMSGARTSRVMLRHIGPNVAGQVLILATTNLGFVMLNLAALSFVGLGIQPPTPEWGAMINEARPFFQSHPMQMITPGLCIVTTVVVFNMVGDSLRDRFDPQIGRR